MTKQGAARQLCTFTDADGATSRICRLCYETFPLTRQFFRSKGNGFHYECRSCHSQAAQKAWRQSGRAKRYGLSNDGYTALLEAQDGHCAVCPETNRLCIDHDHATGLVRGLLCNLHNRLLGLAQDRPQELQALAAYLEHPPAEVHKDLIFPSTNGSDTPGSAPRLDTAQS